MVWPEIDGRRKPPSASEVAAALEESVLEHTGGSLTDDMAAVVLHVPSGR